MNLPLGMGFLDFSEWLRGLIAAIVSGGAGAATSGFAAGIVDPKDFNTGQPAFYKLVLASFCMNGIIGGLNYLRQKPIPGVNQENH